ncbi:heavy metal-binding domain-containing protein [Acidiphilium acidophilum]|uniref:heavy metal-binding domain-containing protein n=1 Tax=Acidiphilium acidophilum TaxID=76588 RepID=UPI002E8E77CD|nr:heavy metal-binding domain-containing protein [Acidiphilium acidophilum]
MLNHMRDDAIAALQAHAASVGTNVMVGMKFDSGEFDARKSNPWRKTSPMARSPFSKSFSFFRY